MTRYRWVICAMLFFATTVNYMDRQVLSLTWQDFIAPEFGWTNTHYGKITGWFSILYAVCMLFAGRFVDWLDTKRGYLWAIGIWSVGACLHAFCGIAVAGRLTGEWTFDFAEARETIATVGDVGLVSALSVSLFVFARFVLALGEAGNFPAAIKATAEYFPRKDRAFSTGIFNSGATVGALAAPVTIPFIARAYGWEWAFLIIGALGFLWMGVWIFAYKKPDANPRVNTAELDYIRQDNDQPLREGEDTRSPRLSFFDCFRYRQTWAFAAGKFMTDGVWWFFLFWAPAYLGSVYGMDATEKALPLFVLYAITLLSIIGGWLPTWFVDKKGMEPYAGRMRAMLIFAFFPLLAMVAQPLGQYTYWIPVVIIGIAGAAHQSWSANIYSTVGDMFPRTVIATVTGIGSMAGGVASYIINVASGILFDYAERTQLRFFGFEGIESGYFIIFCVCSVSYLIGWVIIKALVPAYCPVVPRPRP